MRPDIYFCWPLSYVLNTTHCRVTSFDTFIFRVRFVACKWKKIDFDEYTILRRDTHHTKTFFIANRTSDVYFVREESSPAGTFTQIAHRDHKSTDWMPPHGYIYPGHRPDCIRLQTYGAAQFIYLPLSLCPRQIFAHASWPMPQQMPSIHRIASQPHSRNVHIVWITLVCLMFRSVVTLNNCGLFNLSPACCCCCFVLFASRLSPVSLIKADKLLFNWKEELANGIVTNNKI